MEAKRPTPRDTLETQTKIGRKKTPPHPEVDTSIPTESQRYKSPDFGMKCRKHKEGTGSDIIYKQNKIESILRDRGFKGGGGVMVSTLTTITPG